MNNTDDNCRFRCTVSGGLEVLAENEARQRIPDAEISWTQRGNAGSQLEIICRPAHSIPDLIRFRFVEYVFMELCSMEVAMKDKTTLLEGIADSTAMALQGDKDLIRLDTSVNVWRTVQTLLSDRTDLGLEGLPGVPMSTLPAVDHKGNDSQFLGEQSGGTFIVNTIYTKANVAKAVVDAFLDLVKTTRPEIMDILWLDAGAGSGALLQHLPPNDRIGIDIQPHPGIHEKDFLSVTKAWLVKETQKTHKYICVITNPPFAENSRGDYSAIVKFINHALDLDVIYIGLIVPATFSRQRAWQSLGMNPRARLVARYQLPNDAFFDPSNRSCRHINSEFLVFQLDDKMEQGFAENVENNNNAGLLITPRLRVEGKRSKGDFPWLTTAEVKEAVTAGLQLKHGNSNSETTLTIHAELKALTEHKAKVELYALLNPKKPLSLANCMSRIVPEHSLGWLSSSAKPPVAFAMCQLVMTKARSLQEIIAGKIGSSYAVVVNAMCGEGTIEIESQDSHLPHPFFMISGDKNEATARGTAKRLASLHRHGGKTTRPLVDLVVWDAQRLPLRSGIADVYLADLPFGGSNQRSHQEPSLSGSALDNGLNYNRVMAQAVRVVKCHGRAALLSADCNTLAHAALQLNGFWSVLWRNNLNLGGLAGKLFLMERHKQSFKDFSVWMTGGDTDRSVAVRRIAVGACDGIRLSAMLELEDCADDSSLVSNVELISTFFCTDNSKLSHCYRVWFDECLSNFQSKQLETRIRTEIFRNPPDGLQLR